MKKLILFSFLLLGFLANAQTELWGVLTNGGTSGGGTLFKTDAFGGNLIVKYNFVAGTATVPAVDGQNPYASLIKATDGKLYGMTYAGGTNDEGVIFQYDPTLNIYTKKFDFTYSATGSNPSGALKEASDGKLYGTTSAGGTSGNGVLFQYNPITNVYTKKLDFNEATGRVPLGAMIQAADGKLYGMTVYGGANFRGVIFQYDPITNIYTRKFNFDGAANGQNPYGSLLEAADGNFYGMTRSGGVNNKGVLFQYNPTTNVYTKKMDFSITMGYDAKGSLLQATDGKLYGMTAQGGTTDFGVLFQYDPITNIYTKKVDFSTSSGSNPTGALMQASDGKLYGMTDVNGPGSNYGVLFQFDIATDTYSIKFNFINTAISGSYPVYGTLLETSGTLNINENELSQNFKIYPNPTSGNFNIEINEELLGAKVSVYNILGQKIKDFTLDVTNTNQILNSGMYLLEIEKDGNKIAKKLIVN